MGASIVRLDLGAFESLPRHTRRCVFWEVEPPSRNPRHGLGADSVAGVGESLDTVAEIRSMDSSSYESEFDKEAWISGLLLDWGTCGQVAIDTATQSVVGTAFYAPPNRVPRSYAFPTSPVSHDAVLLTNIRTEPGHDEVATALLDAVVSDLIRRGVRAIEAFGLVRIAFDSGADESAAGPDISAWTDDAIARVARELLEGPDGELCTRCMIDSSFLKDSGFDVVAAHSRFPRFRLELDEGLGWKAEVETALEKLVVQAAVDLATREHTAVPVGCTHRRPLGQQ